MFKLVSIIALSLISTGTALPSTPSTPSQDPQHAKLGEACNADKICGPTTLCYNGICHPEALLGNFCGEREFGWLSAVCTPGSKCVVEDLPGATGKCHPVSAKGGRCGGSSRYYIYVCDDGLKCVGSTDYVSGTCQ